MKRSATILAALALSLVFVVAAAVPASAKTSVSIEARDAEVGDTVTVTVVFKGDYLGRAKAMLSYDPAVISYNEGGQSSGDSGIVKLEGAGDGGDISFSLKFKAVGPGTSKLKITDSELYDLDEQMIGSVGGSTTGSVTITGEASGGDQSAGEQSEAQDSGEQAAEEQQSSGDEPADVSGQSAADDGDEDGGSSAKLYAVIAIAIAAVIICIAVIARTRRRLR